MKSSKLAVLMASLVGVSAAHSQSPEVVNFLDGRTIPDNNPSGLASTKTASFSIVSLTNLAVTLNISGSWNGDLYGYVVHDSGFAILLNRVGKTAGNSLGYSDAGFDVKFDDVAGAGDIHSYHLTLGNPFPLSGALTGTWFSDGRMIDPDFVLDTTSRSASATLSTFNGLNPSGEWTLFLADLSAGNEGVLQSWGLEAMGVVPEPGVTFLFAAGLPALWWMARRRRQ